MLVGLLSALYFLLGFCGIVIFVQVVIGWLVLFNVINTHNAFVRSLVYALERLTDPIYRPIRRLLPNLGGIDFSPLVVLLAIQALRIILGNTIAQMYISG